MVSNSKSNSVKVIIFTIYIFFFYSFQARSQQIKLTQDLELEDLIGEITYSIMDAAKLDRVKPPIYIVNNPNVNAFVSNDGVFAFTGLITFSSDVTQVYGVMAHEVGHLSNNHISRMVNKIYNPSDYKSQGSLKKLAYGLLLPAIPIAAGAAVLAIPALASASLPLGDKWSYSREFETEADVFAVKYLNAVGVSSEGLKGVMSYFDGQINSSNLRFIDKYRLSHPFASDRLKILSSTQNQYKSYNDSHDYTSKFCQLERRFRRSKAKILGYIPNHADVGVSLYSPHECLKESDINFIKQYQYLFALMRYRKYEEAIILVNDMLAKNKGDLFLTESKSSILFGLNKTDEAIDNARWVFKQKPCKNSATALAIMLNATQEPKSALEAIRVLDLYKIQNENDALIKYELAQSYYILGDGLTAGVYEADFNLSISKPEVARLIASRVLMKLEEYEDHPRYNFISNKCQDIIYFARTPKEKKKEEQERKKIRKKGLSFIF